MLNWYFRIVVAVASLMVTHLAQADCVMNIRGEVLCPPPDSACTQDIRGEWWCSPTGGGIALDRYRTPVCGAGACTTDLRGDVRCSTQARGSVALNRYREAECTGGCMAAQAALCTRLK